MDKVKENLSIQISKLDNEKKREQALMKQVINLEIRIREHTQDKEIFLQEKTELYNSFSEAIKIKIGKHTQDHEALHQKEMKIYQTYNSLPGTIKQSLVPFMYYYAPLHYQKIPPSVPNFTVGRSATSVAEYSTGSMTGAAISANTVATSLRSTTVASTNVVGIENSAQATGSMTGTSTVATGLPTQEALRYISSKGVQIFPTKCQERILKDWNSIKDAQAMTGTAISASTVATGLLSTSVDNPSTQEAMTGGTAISATSLRSTTVASTSVAVENSAQATGSVQAMTGTSTVVTGLLSTSVDNSSTQEAMVIGDNAQAISVSESSHDPDFEYEEETDNEEDEDNYILEQLKKKYRCNYCFDYSTNSASHFAKHMKLHDPSVKSSQFKCSHCIFSSIRKDTIKSHMKHVHPLVI